MCVERENKGEGCVSVNTNLVVCNESAFSPTYKAAAGLFYTQ